jgi:hypothetical protein
MMLTTVHLGSGTNRDPIISRLSNARFMSLLKGVKSEE